VRVTALTDGCLARGCAGPGTRSATLTGIRWTGRFWDSSTRLSPAMTKRKKDEPGAAALRGGDTFARLAKSAEKPPRLVPRELREAGPKRRTRGTQDKSEATSAPETAGTESEGGAGERLSGKEKQGVGRMESPPGCLRNASPAALRNRPRVALPTVPLPVFPVAPAGTVAASPAAPAIQGTPVKKVRLAEALRSSGLDELTVAQNYVAFRGLCGRGGERGRSLVSKASERQHFGASARGARNA
jgi:hypothetical protein